MEKCSCSYYIWTEIMLEEIQNQIALNASATGCCFRIVNGYITSTSAAAVIITLPPVALIATQLGSSS